VARGQSSLRLELAVAGVLISGAVGGSPMTGVDEQSLGEFGVRFECFREEESGEGSLCVRWGKNSNGGGNGSLNRGRLSAPLHGGRERAGVGLQVPGASSERRSSSGAVARTPAVMRHCAAQTEDQGSCLVCRPSLHSAPFELFKYFLN
jgi:hypothetical protein